MAELGVAASVIELINAGFALSQFLDETYHDYKNAPSEVLEIATEVNICCELMQPLGEQLKAGSVNYTQRFETSVKALVGNSAVIFENIRDLIPRNKDGTIDRGILPKWTYVLNKNKISKQRRKLAEVRQMFIFIKQAMNEAKPASAAGGMKDPGTQSEQPVVLSGPGFDSSGTPVTFYATLRMQPAPISTEIRYTREDATRGAAYPSQLKRPAGYLKSLRQNPYFSAELLKPRAPETRGARSRSSEPEVRDLAVEKIVARERAKEEVEYKIRMRKDNEWKQSKHSASFPDEEAYNYKGKYRIRDRDRYADRDRYDDRDRNDDRDRDDDRDRYNDRLTEGYDYKRKENEGKSKYSEQDDDDEESVVPDDYEAADDVNDLVASWFGNDASRERTHRPSLTVTDTSRPNIGSGSRPSSKSPSPAPKSPSPTPVSPRESTKEIRVPSPGGYNQTDSSFRCDICDKKIRGIRHECRRCRNYYLCGDCFNAEQAHWLHRHPESEFVALRDR